MEIEKQLKDMNEAFEAFKKNNDATLTEIKTKGYASADRIEQEKKLNDRMDAIDAEIKKTAAAMTRTAQVQEEANKKGKKSIHSEVFTKFMRQKNFNPSEEQLKAINEQAEFKDMTVQLDQDGGFLVSPEMSTEVVKKVFETSPIRQLASVITIGTDSYEILEDLDEVGSGWVGETEARPKTTSAQLNKILIPVHEIYAEPLASQKILDDAFMDVESWLAGKVSDKFSRQENTAFVNGNGVKKPKGFLNYASGTSFGTVEQVDTAGVGAIVGDDLMTLMYALKAAYAPNASFMMKRSTVPVLRKLKGTDGQYLWAPGMNGNTQSSILGTPIYEANDMPALANDALAIAYGDFKQAYQIVDRIGIRTLRDPFTQKGYVVFYTTKRVGGAVKNFEALKLLHVKAS